MSKESKYMSGYDLIVSGIYDCDSAFVAAIMKAAKDDYEEAYCVRDFGRMDAIERFTRSKIYSSLCDVDPDVFMELTRKSASNAAILYNEWAGTPCSPTPILDALDDVDSISICGEEVPIISSKEVNDACGVYLPTAKQDRMIYETMHRYGYDRYKRCDTGEEVYLMVPEKLLRSIHKRGRSHINREFKSMFEHFPSDAMPLSRTEGISREISADTYNSAFPVHMYWKRANGSRDVKPEKLLFVYSADESKRPEVYRYNYLSSNHNVYKIEFVDDITPETYVGRYIRSFLKPGEPLYFRKKTADNTNHPIVDIKVVLLPTAITKKGEDQ